MIRLDRQPTLSELRWFGVSAALLLAGVGAALWMRGAASASVLCWTNAVLLTLVYYSVPSTQRRIHRAWLLLAFPLAWAMSTLALVALYFGVITPIGVLSRLAGRDPLQLKKAPAESHWIRRKPDSGPITRYLRQH
jgi:hypothetical protein